MKPEMKKRPRARNGTSDMIVATPERYESMMKRMRKDGALPKDAPDIPYDKMREFIRERNYEIEFPPGYHVTTEFGAQDTVLRGIVGAMGLIGDKVHQDAGTLSGGEKTKLALGILVAGRHNLLLLDEPTNNLDPGSRRAVAEGLRDWPGSIVLVSHDADFVKDLEPDKVLLMPEGQLDHWSSDYLDLVELA